MYSGLVVHSKVLFESRHICVHVSPELDTGFLFKSENRMYYNVGLAHSPYGSKSIHKPLK